MFSIRRRVHSPIPWVGGKGSLLDDILRMVPWEFERYVEVFGGGASVLLAMYPCKFEVYNDFNSDLVNMFRCIKERSLSFVKEANMFPLNSRQEFSILKDFLEGNEPNFSHYDMEVGIAEEVFNRIDAEIIKRIYMTKADLYDVQRAVAFYKLIRQSYAGSGKSFGGQPVNLPSMLNHIYSVAKRFTNVVVENKDFGDLIPIQDKEGTFMYIDPPYYMTEGFYGGFERKDHIRLYDAICNAKHSKILLSYNDCEFTRELYKDFTIYRTTRMHSMAQRFNAGSQFGELLIANYDINERSRYELDRPFDFGKDDFFQPDYFRDYRCYRPNNHTMYIAQGLSDVR